MALPRIIPALFLICVAALAVVQSTGFGAAFLCLCSGRVFVTPAAECHGPHGDHCVSLAAEAADCGEHTEEPCDTEHHSALTKELKHVRGAQVSAPEMALVEMTTLADFAEVRRLVLAPGWSRSAMHDRASRPPPGVAIARTVVLLI